MAMTFKELRAACLTLPQPGSSDWRRLKREIDAFEAAHVCIGKFIQDSEGYLGLAGDEKPCECTWFLNSRAEWESAWKFGKFHPELNPKRKTFRQRRTVTLRRRINGPVVIPDGYPENALIKFYGENAGAGLPGVPFIVWTELWSPAAVDAGAFHCSANGVYFCLFGQQFSPQRVDGREICFEETTLHYWGSDDDYHLQPEPARADQLRAAPGLPAYHQTARPWAKQRSTEVMFGCELEILANKDRMEIWKFAKDNGMIGEQDGSIDRTYGIEIVANPGSLKWHQDPDGPWMKFLKFVNEKVVDVQDGDKWKKVARAKGWDAGKGYGMHVSLNRLSMTKPHQANVISFINDNIPLCETVAGRTSSDTACYKIKDLQGIMEEIEHGSPTKYEAIAVRGEQRLEVRIFRSTIKPEGFLRNVEFCAAAVEFTRGVSVAQRSSQLTELNFKKWLKENRETYPNLFAFFMPKPVIKTNKRKAYA